MVAESEATTSLVQAYFGSKSKVDPKELFGQYTKASDSNAPRILSGLSTPSGPSVVARACSNGGHVGKAPHRQFRPPLVPPSIEQLAIHSLDTAKNACPPNQSNGVIAHRNLSDGSQIAGQSDLASFIDGCREAMPPRRLVGSSAGASAKSALDPKDMECQMRQMVQCLRDTGSPLPGLLSLVVGKNSKSEIPEARTDTDKSCQCPSEISHATTPSWRSRSFPPHYRPIDVQSNPAVSSSARATPESGCSRRPLPPLPEDATRRRSTPLSEVVRLTEIDSQVHEANAMLVESFLNVKRRPLPEPMTASESSFNSSCSSTERSGSKSRGTSAPSSARRYLRKARPPDMERLPEDGESHIGSEA